MALETYLDAAEVGEQLGVSPAALSGYVKTGKFPKPVKATRGRSEHGRTRMRSYWRKSDIDKYQDMLLMQQEEAERYNDELLANMGRELRQSIDEREIPVGLRNNKTDEILRGSRRETESTQEKPRLELLRGS